MKQRGARAAAGHLWRTRALSLLLALVMVLGLVPEWDLSVTAEAHWADGYLDQMVEWGFMNSSQTVEPNRALTRAEFMAIVNRAYGYHEKGSIPFTDVKPEDWFYDDVSIAYTANYINGTSPTTASPNSTLTREMATAVLGRNMMLEESPGELINFSDGRNVSNWAVGIVKAATENYLIDGYTDGTFQPKRSVTRAEMAALMTRTVGTPLQEAGEYTLDGVYGNVTITSPGVTLKDTIISGDLYVTGGVGLGDVRLENVTVLGRIIAAGTGVGEKGDVSILMRNVTADELLVDNLRDQYVSLRTDGVTEIGKVTVATSAYLEDNTPQGSGMKLISFEGSENSQLDLAGRIEEVITKTPKATVRLAKGTIETMTVDEAAPDSKVIIDRGAEIKTLNLDVGTAVSGEGDIKTLNVNAPGSTVTMLPDQINIRPGLTATIHGQEMDAAAAAEASRDPMILAGYPVANDVAPTTFNAQFKTNKQGTVYWAVSALSDGSIDAEELINPSSYGSPAVQKGSVSAPAADKMVASKVNSLLPGGSYYLSAVMVDGRSDRSPVKVIAFTTPDNTKPDFVTGYPYFSRLTNTAAQVTVMPTKTCKLYYIVLPKGATAPTADQLKANSISGNLGYGVMDVEQNKEIPIDVSNRLEELKSYDLYLWLTDADGVNSSAVKKMSFTTVDKTPPEFIMEPTAGRATATTVPMTFRLNETGTVFWAVVKEGAPYPYPKRGETEVDLSSLDAKMQVASGMNALQSGRTNANPDRDGTFTVSGLEAQTSYDLWYVAQDAAGNYSEKVQKVTIHTLDTEGPDVTQVFSDVQNDQPLPNSDVTIEFTEGVKSTAKGDGTSLLELYKAYADAPDGDKPALREAMVRALRNTIKLYQVSESGDPLPVKERTDKTSATETDWVIDYRNAVITSNPSNGHMLVTFPSKNLPDSERGINLASGATYHFEIENIADNANNPLAHDQPYALPQFTTVFAEVTLSPFTLDEDQVPVIGNAPVRLDYRFRMIPRTTSKVIPAMTFDMLLFTDATVAYDLYYRVVDENGVVQTNKYFGLPAETAANNAGHGWYRLNNSGVLTGTQTNPAGRSLCVDFGQCKNGNGIPAVNTLDDSRTVFYEFAISLTQMGDSTTPDEWSDDVNVRIYAVSGANYAIDKLANGLSLSKWESFSHDVNDGGVISIGRTANNSRYLEYLIEKTDTAVPTFYTGFPRWKAEDIEDTYIDMGLRLNRKGTIYYVVAPASELTPTLADGTTGDDAVWAKVQNSAGDTGITRPAVAAPSNLIIYEAEKYYEGNAKIKYGTVDYPGGSGVVNKQIEELQPETKYYVYFVLKGEFSDLSEVYVYKFETPEVKKPKITIRRSGGKATVETAPVNSIVDYLMFTVADLENVSDMSIEISGGNLRPDAQGYDSTKPMTVLEAMLETYSGPEAEYVGYSCFDAYASDTLKDRIASTIRNGAEDANVMFDGTVMPTSTNNPPATVDHTKEMKPLTSYYIIAVGRHATIKEGGHEVDTFGAAGNIRIAEANTPKPNKLNCGGNVQIDENGKISGYIRFGFDIPLYWNQGGINSKTKPVYQTMDKAELSGDDEDDWIGLFQDIGNGLDMTNNRVWLTEEKDTPSSTFRIDFKEQASNFDLTLFDGGYIANSGGVIDSANKMNITVSGRTYFDEKGNLMGTTSMQIIWGGSTIETIFDRTFGPYVLKEAPPATNPDPDTSSIAYDSKGNAVPILGWKDGKPIIGYMADGKTPITGTLK